MSAQVDTTPHQDGNASLKDALAQHVDKMMGLKLSKLKKLAKAKGIPEGEIEVAAAGAEDEDDAKHILINLLLKAQCMKAVPSPAKGNMQQPEEDLHSQMCQRCQGCIRPPKHEGSCMDGQCNDIAPEVPKEEVGLDVAAELARHKAVKEEVLRKVEEKEAQCKAAEKEAQRKAADEKEARRHKEAAAEKEAQRKVAVEREAQRKAAAEEARTKVLQEEARRAAVEQEKQRAAALEKEEADRRVAEAEAARKVAAAEAEAVRQMAAEAEAAEKRMQELKAQRQEEEEAEMAAMDRNCVETFLDTVQAREKIRTPLKGTILYTKHIRPNRPAGTSIDVKDSSFRCLGNFLKFLEDEGLLRLKPGLSDPVVTEICYGACRDYKSYPHAKPSAIKDATSATAGHPVSEMGGRWQ